MSIPTIGWRDGQIELPELTPPYRISNGYEACRELQHALYEANVPHKRASVEAWTEATDGIARMQRRDLLDRASRFLNGTRLVDHEERFAEVFGDYLDHDPQPRAAAILVAVISRRESGVTWHVAPVALVRGWLSARVAFARWGS